MIKGLTYHRPRSLDEACDLLAEHEGDIRVLGGGTSLLPRMARGEITAGHVLDIRGLGLDEVRDTADGVAIGAMVTYSDVLDSPILGARVPLLARVSRGITGGRQITGQGTLVGSACFNFPTTDMPAVLTALRARFRLVGSRGSREVAAEEFFLDAYRVDVRPGELVTAVVVPATGRGGYCKVKHSSGSWPIATAAAVRDDTDPTRLRLVLGAVQAVPLVLTVVEPDQLTDLVRGAVTRPWTDVLAPGSYRVSVAPVVAARAIRELESAS